MSRDGQPYISPNSPWPPAKLPFPFWVSPQLDPRKNPLSFHALMWSPFCNPFVFTFMHVMGVCTPPPQRSDVQICKSKLNCSCGAEIPIRSGRFGVFRSILFVFIFFRTLLRFFAHSKNSSLFISTVSAPFPTVHPRP